VPSLRLSHPMIDYVHVPHHLIHSQVVDLGKQKELALSLYSIDLQARLKSLVGPLWNLGNHRMEVQRSGGK